MATRGRKKKSRKPRKCKDCGAPGAYGVDQFGIPTDHWRCRACYEQAIRRIVREDYFMRYGPR